MRSAGHKMNMIPIALWWQLLHVIYVDNEIKSGLNAEIPSAA